MMENGLLNNAKLFCRKECYECQSFIATIFDADFIREKVIKDFEKINIYIDKKQINCLGCYSGVYASYCNINC